jgi:hypothetical protein
VKITAQSSCSGSRSVIRIFFFIFIILHGASFQRCTTPGGQESPNRSEKLFESDEFKSYWYSGKAEIDSYNLVQSRYGESRQGKAVLIFVTEDFSKAKQVKVDNPAAAGEDKVSVMKMNFTKNFVTGIYPYSMMLSAFTPIDRNRNPRTLKVSMSSQEWCGHVYSQLNLEEKEYSFLGHSYFEKEGEEMFSVDAPWLEDEFWTLARLDPNGLPVGEITVIPGLFFTRLQHMTLRPQKAIAQINEDDSGVKYTVTFQEPNRQLAITYEKAFPHKILGWEETITVGEKSFTTSASLDKSMQLDYWTKNKNEFRFLRDSLGLSQHNY